MFRQTLEDEARALTNLGNDYRIRHHEVDKVPLNDSSHLGYVFYRRMLSLMRRLPRIRYIADSFWGGAYRRFLAHNDLKVIPSFSLRDVDGSEWSLDESLDKPTLLVFTSPHCGPCKSVYPVLRALRDDEEAGSMNLVMLSRGAARTNRALVEEFGLEGIVMLGSRKRVEEQLDVKGTPWVVLVGPGARAFYGGVANEMILRMLARAASHRVMTSGAAR